MTDRRGDTNRLDKLETKVERIVTILDGEPNTDLDGNMHREGGLVQLMHKIDRQTNGSRSVWTRNQKIAGTGIAVTLVLGMLPSMAMTVRALAMWITQI